MDKKGWNRKSDSEKGFYEYFWDCSRLYVNTEKKLGPLSKEEAISLAEWVLESAPNTGYKIITIFNEKPTYVGFSAASDKSKYDSSDIEVKEVLI